MSMAKLFHPTVPKELGQVDLFYMNLLRREVLHLNRPDAVLDALLGFRFLFAGSWHDNVHTRTAILAGGLFRCADTPLIPGLIA